MKLATSINIPHAYHLSKRFTPHRSSIHSKRSAYVSRDALKPLEARERSIPRRDRQFLLSNSCAGGDCLPFHFQFFELAPRQMHDDPSDTPIPNQQIRPSTQNKNWHSFTAAVLH